MTSDTSQQEICATCNNIPEFFQSMECGHHQCQKCAKEILLDYLEQHGIDLDELTCNDCNQSTKIDEEALEELKNYSSSKEQLESHEESSSEDEKFTDERDSLEAEDKSKIPSIVIIPAQEIVVNKQSKAQNDGELDEAEKMDKFDEGLGYEHLKNSNFGGISQISYLSTGGQSGFSHTHESKVSNASQGLTHLGNLESISQGFGPDFKIGEEECEEDVGSKEDNSPLKGKNPQKSPVENSRKQLELSNINQNTPGSVEVHPQGNDTGDSDENYVKVTNVANSKISRKPHFNINFAEEMFVTQPKGIKNEHKNADLLKGAKATNQQPDSSSKIPADPTTKPTTKLQEHTPIEYDPPETKSPSISPQINQQSPLKKGQKSFLTFGVPSTVIEDFNECSTISDSRNDNKTMADHSEPNKNNMIIIDIGVSEDKDLLESSDFNHFPDEYKNAWQNFVKNNERDIETIEEGQEEQSPDHQSNNFQKIEKEPSCQIMSVNSVVSFGCKQFGNSGMSSSKLQDSQGKSEQRNSNYNEDKTSNIFPDQTDNNSIEYGPEDQFEKVTQNTECQ